MALIATKGEIPKNAVVLDRRAALQYQWNQIRNWDNPYEVWPLRWGVMGLSAVAALSGFRINTHFRRKFKLRSHGYFASSIPTVVGPGMMAAAFHAEMVTSDLLLSETKCPLCLQYRATVVQIATGLFYPLLVCPVINTLLVLRHGTYKVPYWSDFRGTFSLWWKFTKPLGKTFLVLSCFHAIAACYITYEEGEKLYKMKMNLMKNQNDKKNNENLIK